MYSIVAKIMLRYSAKSKALLQSVSFMEVPALEDVRLREVPALEDVRLREVSAL